MKVKDPMEKLEEIINIYKEEYLKLDHSEDIDIHEAKHRLRLAMLADATDLNNIFKRSVARIIEANKKRITDES